MIDYDTETITAETAIEIGLYDAIRRGETKFGGRYECGRDGVFEFKQRTLVFTDKSGNLRVNKFKDIDEVLKFIEYVRTKENENV